MGTDVQKKKDGGRAPSVADRTNTLVSMLEGKREAFERALAHRVDPDRFIQIVATAFMDTPRLRDASALSIFRAAIESAQVGLKPDGEEAAIVPYWNSQAREMEAQFQPMYIGLGRLMLRAGAKKYECRVVREGDEFHYQYGLNPDLVHVPGPSGSRGDVTHSYAVVWLPDGSTQFEVMDREELDKIKGFAEDQRGGKTTPAWSNWEDQMHRKAPLRRLRKFVELDAAASAAFRKDAMLEGGEAVPLGELDPAYETRTVEERARGHARRQTADLRQRIDRAEREDSQRLGTGTPPEAEDADASGGTREPWSPDDEVPSGKHAGKTWRAVIAEDRRYAESVVEHGWILDEAGIEGLRRHLNETATTAPENDAEPEGVGEGDENAEDAHTGDEGDSPGESDDADTLLKRGKRAVHDLVSQGKEVTVGEREELELFHHDGEIDALRDAVRALEERAGIEPDLFNGEG